MRWLELNAAGFVVNICVWDGIAPYQPEGIAQLLPCDEHAGVSYGWQIIDGVWVAPEESVDEQQMQEGGD